MVSSCALVKILEKTLDIPELGFRVFVEINPRSSVLAGCSLGGQANMLFSSLHYQGDVWKFCCSEEISFNETESTPQKMQILK